MRTLFEARLRITCPAFATAAGGNALGPRFGTPDPPEGIDLSMGGSGRGWHVLVVEDMPSSVPNWTLHKLTVEPQVTPAAFYLTSAYDLTVGMPRQLWIHESVWRVIGTRALAVPIDFPAGAKLRIKLRLEDSYLADRLGEFHGPVDMRVALVGEETQ